MIVTVRLEGRRNVGGANDSGPLDEGVAGRQLGQVFIDVLPIRMSIVLRQRTQMDSWTKGTSCALQMAFSSG